MHVSVLRTPAPRGKLPFRIADPSQGASARPPIATSRNSPSPCRRSPERAVDPYFVPSIDRQLIDPYFALSIDRRLIDAYFVPSIDPQPVDAYFAPSIDR